MDTYQHSVFLEKSKCTGCTTCVKHCPTEAIRIKDGVAVINSYRCIDCGECIRICPHGAKHAKYSKFQPSTLKEKWKIALPAPTLYGQFVALEDTESVLQGLLDIGFDDVYEVALGAEIVSAYTRKYVKYDRVKKPVISSACPAVLRLISLRFPTLLENVLPLLPPMEVAAKAAREKALKDHKDLKPDDIYVCFISPCPAKVSYVRNGFGNVKSNVDDVISISDVYFKLLSVMKKGNETTLLPTAGRLGVGWATSGGESTSLFNDKYLAADGIDNIIKVLDQIENGLFPGFEFVELNACPGGCVGGVMSVENPFVARSRLRTLKKYMPVTQNPISANDISSVPQEMIIEEFPEYMPINKLSNSISESMKMLEQIQQVIDSLPGIDCGACGAPSCRSFAEDCIRGYSKIEDCLIKCNLEKNMNG